MMWPAEGVEALWGWLLIVGNEARSAEGCKVRAYNLLICVA